MSAGVFRLFGGPMDGKLIELAEAKMEVFRPGDASLGEESSVLAGHYIPHPRMKQALSWKPLRVGEEVTPSAKEDVDLAFVRLVKELRAAQVEYFKGRDREVLVRSKALEKEVDARVEWLLRVGGGG